ncbi:MAG: hypothetical protein C7N36_21380 [Bacteroidetes bacterium]|nr:MAG: hypothetical protein C7N36_21380 [Bacteroidota bacterium]
MSRTLPATIDEVIAVLDQIIQETEANHDANGYFAVLYQKVTVQVKAGIEQGLFADGPRMAALDVIFANRYLAAWFAHQDQQPLSRAWQAAFAHATSYWPIVLQHLLIGMNAHISLDLGIAAAQVSTEDNLADLRSDFNKINDVLAALVHEVQDDLTRIWPTLFRILSQTKSLDDLLVDYSMRMARDDAWAFASTIAGKSGSAYDAFLQAKDEQVARNADKIARPAFLPRLALACIRLGERGSVREKIQHLTR